MKRIAEILFALALAACATQPQTPAETIASVKQGYEVAQKAVILYDTLPLCGSLAAVGSKIGCSDPATVIKLDAADTAAVRAIKAADDAIKAGSPNAMVLLNAASAATTTLSSQTPKVKP